MEGNFETPPQKPTMFDIKGHLGGFYDERLAVELRERVDNVGAEGGVDVLGDVVGVVGTRSSQVRVEAHHT